MFTITNTCCVLIFPYSVTVAAEFALDLNIVILDAKTNKIMPGKLNHMVLVSFLLCSRSNSSLR